MSLVGEGGKAAKWGGSVEITEVKLTLKNEERLKGFANITFDNAFVVRGLKIISGNKDLFVSMPSKRRPNGSFQDIAHPINSEMRKMIESKVLEVYHELVGKMESEAAS